MEAAKALALQLGKSLGISGGAEADAPAAAAGGASAGVSAAQPSGEANRRANWDPLRASLKKQKPSKGCIARVRKDLKMLYKEPLPGIVVAPDPGGDFLVLHSLITGPADTPYAGGLFAFHIRMTADYPSSPPYARIMTTGGGRVRFNPNLYGNGKVCLSLLGTWPGPGWTPANNLASVLLSIQSLLGSRPLTQEPGLERASPDDIAAHAAIIAHETVRVAAIDMAEHAEARVPASLADTVRRAFVSFEDVYLDTCERYKHLDGQAFRDPHPVKNKGTFRFQALADRVKVLAATLRGGASKTDDSSSDDSSDDDSSDEEEE